ncbi:hypothetical protein FXO38_00578 [Capsicum annuum]|nr:hypothetical protein FXO38_00578 [Capsicum annuum]
MVRRLLCSARPVVIQTPVNPTASDQDLQQAQLWQLAQRTTALPFGRGAFTLSTTCTLLTEALTVPKLILAGRLPSQQNATVSLDPNVRNIQELKSWPEFHNAVAAGLRLAPPQGKMSRTWILYNKPEEPTVVHAGLLLALGLRGHLRVLTITDIYQYYSQEHESTTVGLMLGLAASYRGTMQPAISKLGLKILKLIARFEVLGEEFGQNDVWNVEDRYSYEEDGDYGGYEYSHDQEMYVNEGYNFEGACKMNDDPNSYSEYGDDEEPCESSIRKMGHVRSITFPTPTIEDYDMSEVERATCALKHIQGLTLLWWELIRKFGRTWSFLKGLMRSAHVPMGYTKLYNVDPRRNVHFGKVSICVIPGCLLVLDDWCYRNYIIPPMVDHIGIPLKPLLVPYFLEGYKVFERVKVSFTLCADMANGGEHVPKEKMSFEDLTREILDASKACGGPSHQGKEEYSQELQGNIANSYTLVHVNDDCVASRPLSMSISLPMCECHDSLPLDDNVNVVSVDTLVDPIDDRIDSSCKINLCSPSVEAIVMNDCTLSCEICVNQLVCETSPPLEDVYDEIN